MASNQCSQIFQDLLKESLTSDLPVTQASEVSSQLVLMFDGLLHEDPWERYECFQIEEMLQEMIQLILAS
jgi:hypothetical protein